MFCSQAAGRECANCHLPDPTKAMNRWDGHLLCNTCYSYCRTHGEQEWVTSACWVKVSLPKGFPLLRMENVGLLGLSIGLSISGGAHRPAHLIEKARIRLARGALHKGSLEGGMCYLGVRGEGGAQSFIVTSNPTKHV